MSNLSTMLVVILACMFSPVFSHLPRPGVSPFMQSGWNNFNPSWNNPWALQSGFGTTFDMMNRFVSPITSWNTRGISQRPETWTNTWATGGPFNGFPTLPMPNNQGLPSGLNNMFPITNTIEDRFVSSPGVNNQFPRGNGAINQFPGVNGALNQIPGANGAISQFPVTNGAINPFPGGNGAINQITGLNGDLSQFPGTNGPFSQFPNTIDLNNQLAASRDAQWNNGLSGLPSGAINGNPAFSPGSALGSSWSAPTSTTGVAIPGAQNNGLQWAGQNRPWKK